MKNKISKEEFDNEELYCRRLGHYLKFRYCRKEHDGMPCFKIRDCWFTKIPVDEYLAQNFEIQELDYIFKPPQPKIASLVEIIQKAQSVKKQS